MPNRDSLKAIIQTTKDPIQKLDALRELGHAYYENKRDSALFFFEQGVATAKQINSKLWEADAFNSLGFVSYILGNYPRALQFLTQAKTIAEDPNSEKGEWKSSPSGFVSPHVARLSILARSYQHLATLYSYTRSSTDTASPSLDLYRKALAISTSIADTTMMGIINMNTSRQFSLGNDLDSVIFYHKKALQLMNAAGYQRYIGNVMYIMGEAYRKHQQPETAKTYYWYGMEQGKNIENTRSAADNSLALANLLLSQGNTDSAIYYGYKAADLYRSTFILAGLADSYASLSASFSAKNRIDSAFHYQGLSLSTRKELDVEDKSRRFQQLAFDEQLKAQEAAEQERLARNRIIMSILLGGVAVLAAIGIFLYRNNIARKKANQLLAQKNRELEIESSLDRVRTKAMAMHRSEDLHELIGAVYQELVKLDITLNRCFIMINHPGSDDTTWWMASHENPSIQRGYLVPDHRHPPYIAYLDAWKQGSKLLNYTLEGKEKEDWDRFLFEETELKQLPEFIQASMRSVKRAYWSSAFNKFGCLGIGSLEPLSQQASEILQKFSRAFEQTYTRFLDLKNAEANARESQIEAALERIRSRSMAMHKSEELNEVANVLFQQLRSLGSNLWTTAVVLCKPDSTEDEFWFANEKQVFPPVFVPNDQERIHSAMYAAWKNQEDLFAYAAGGQELEDHYNYLLTVPGLKENLERVRTSGLLFPTWQKWHAAYFRYGYLFIITKEEYEEVDIFPRFAKVFEQAYTRFLDLKKAEAQAREAQIQLALERARSQSMTMQRSSELDDTLRVFHEQVLQLGISSEFSFLWLPDEEKDRHIFWAAWAENNSTGYNSKAINYPMDRNEPATAVCLTDWKGSQPVVSYRVPPEGVPGYFAAWSELIAGVEELKPENFKEGLYYVEAFIKYGCFGVMVRNELKEDEKEILRRFAVEFESTYTRFLDLQKAEAQAREAQVESSLERVRSRTMAMHHTSELQDVIHTVHKELLNLNLSIKGGSFVVINEDIKDILRCWGSGGTADTSEEITVPDFNMKFCIDLIEGIKKGPGFFTEEFSQEEKKAYFSNLLQIKPWSDLGDEQKNEILASEGGYTRSVAVSRYTSIFIINENGRVFTESENEILKRFAKVLEQTYTRFMDLQKAEAQAREAHIEAALEKVRSRSLAMHSPTELGEVVTVIVEKLTELGVVLDKNGVILCTYFPDSKDVMHWIATPDSSMAGNYLLPYFDHPIFNDAWQSKYNGDEYFSKGYSVTEKNSFFEYAFEHSDYKYFPDDFKQWIFQNDKHFLSFAWQKNSAILIPSHTGILPTDADKQTLIRFSKVFEQSYTRFLDLKQAEAQARESQIQLALERVRARTMAMQRSDELPETSYLLFQQMKELGVTAIQNSIAVIKEEEGLVKLSTTVRGNPEPKTLNVPITDPHVMAKAHAAWKEKSKSLVIEISGQELMEYNAYRNSFLETKVDFPEDIWIVNIVFFSKGWLSFSSNQKISDESFQLLKRFAHVFEQTYTRFLDLQKAEAQAREAQIEAALERIRSRSLAMHHTDELQDVVNVAAQQLLKMDIDIDGGMFIAINDEVKNDLPFWAAAGAADYVQKVNLPFFDHPTFTGLRNAILNRELFYTEYYSKEEKDEFMNHMFQYPPWKMNSEEKKQDLLARSGGYTRSLVVNHYTCIGITNHHGKIFSEEDNKVLKRFGAVLEQSYTRFLDLQKAEDQAREARIEAALEKVRSRTMSMQRSDELAETAAVMFRQLISLGIEPNRLYIIIIKEENGDMESWITDEDGSKVNIGFKGNLHNNLTLHKMYEGWKSKQKSLVIDMHGDELQNYFHYLHEVLNVPFKGGLEQKRRVQHIAYFSKGLIGIASPEPQPAETIQLLERFAAVFNLTFTRFNDLKIAEAHALQAEQDLIAIKEAKKKAEQALTELKQTQAQLIQAEKMASLGELTAGIAHEIQNPLNFVNNFSQLNFELVAEGLEAISSGNLGDAEEILDTLAKNSNKILEHGKRADAIVKGMLQHSRSSSGVKEPTDLNKLADEYLRLAYHGFRAKDKSFNATIHTDFDPAVGIIPIMPQDLGRVLLNFYNNAFYAVNEQSKKSINGYEPTIQVVTKRAGQEVRISVTDNGTGIPEKIKDKIFQPFFTTKPTGEGTGLGLSLSYDIVKAHGGNLNAETKEGAGTSFVINLPTTS